MSTLPNKYDVAQNTNITNIGNNVRQNNFTATVAPIVTNDSSQGYSIGSTWFNTVTNEVYQAFDVTVGSAVWRLLINSTSNQALTNKTINCASNTVTNVPLGSVSGTLAVGNGGTGKTSLASNKILQGNTTGVILDTLTAPTGAIVGDTDSQALTNKTINCSLNTVTNVPLGSVSGTLAVGNGGTGATSLTLNRILQGNATGAILSSLVAPTGAIVGDTDSQALTNKTINCSLNTVTNVPLGSVSGTLAVGNGGTGATSLTLNRILQGNATGAILSSLVAPTGAIVGTTDSQTLTNKTLVDASTIFSDDGTPSKQAKFELTNIAVSTTRTTTLPDRDGVNVVANIDMPIVLSGATDIQCIQYNGSTWVNTNNSTNYRTLNTNGNIGASTFLTSNGATSTESSAQMLNPKTGKIGLLYVTLTVAPSGANSRTFNVRINGVNTALTVTITGTATTGSNIASFPATTAGDLVSLQCVNNGGSNTTVIASFAFF